MEAARLGFLSWLLATSFLVPGIRSEATPDPDPYYHGHHHGYHHGYHHSYHRPYHHYPTYAYQYTHVCRALIARPYLLASLHGLLSYYNKHCYGTYQTYPAFGLGW